jgi:cytochrome c oxidase subunit 2
VFQARQDGQTKARDTFGRSARPWAQLTAALLAWAPAWAHAQHKGSFWFPTASSTSAPQTDWLFDVILAITIFFMLLIVGLMGTFLVLYRRRPGHKAERTSTHMTSLELTWTIIPSILAIFIFYFGISGYIDVRTPPADAHEVQVTGQKWAWLFTYPNGIVSPDLHVPAGEATRLTMRSEDVIHSMYIPAFRAKMDVVPGRYSKLWFTPTEPGQHQIFCAEYCGTGHSSMLSQAYVHTREGYEAWLRDEEEKSMNKSPVALGGDLYKTRGCAQCHSVDGRKGIGPSFRAIWGEKQVLADGSSIEVDENYVRESILEPMAKVVAGYAPVMPTFKGKLKDKEINGLIEYIKSLKE